MKEQAKPLPASEAAAEAVKAYIRMNRARLAEDGELLALLVPDRADLGDARDFQRFVIDKLASENTALKAERDALKGSQNASARLGEGVRRFVLELLDARSFAEAIAVMMAAAPSFGADRAAICVESDDGAATTRTEGVRLIPPARPTWCSAATAWARSCRVVAPCCSVRAVAIARAWRSSA